jgi:hypothetical protein
MSDQLMGSGRSLLDRLAEFESRIRALEGAQQSGILGTDQTIKGGHDRLDALLGAGIAAPNGTLITGFNADQVDSIHAAMTPTASKLLSLDADARFPSHGVTGDWFATGQIAQAGKAIRAVFSRAGIVDNVATSVFTITTPNSGGVTDGGGYSCAVHALIGHQALSSSGTAAVKSFTAQFGRVMRNAGLGVNTTVVEDVETASASTNAAARDIGAVTMTVVETTEYVQSVLFTIDLTGTGVATGEVTLLAEVVWNGFTAAPVLAAA